MDVIAASECLCYAILQILTFSLIADTVVNKEGTIYHLYAVHFAELGVHSPVEGMREIDSICYNSFACAFHSQ
jgi:hypothetical protein